MYLIIGINVKYRILSLGPLGAKMHQTRIHTFIVSEENCLWLLCFHKDKTSVLWP